jgi:phosphoglycerate dehydrogenase-like enzyme
MVQETTEKMEQKKGIVLVTVDPSRIDGEHLEILRRASGGRELVHAWERAEMEKLLDRTEIFIGFGPWDMCFQMPLLKWIQAWSAGVDGLLNHPKIRELPAAITNTSGIHRETITEHIFSLILAWNRRLSPVLAAQKRHEWLKLKDSDIPVLSGKTMLILGYGEIGEETALAARAFSLRVIGVRRRPPVFDGTAQAVQIETTVKLPSLLPQADYVVNLLPLTPDTKEIMGPREFNLMKPGAVYINAGRGQTTDQDALIAALRSGRLAAALLDVTVPEPLPPDSPLWDMENVIITPHYAGLRSDYAPLAMSITVDNMGRYNRGETLRNLVDRTAGY